MADGPGAPAGRGDAAPPATFEEALRRAEAGDAEVAMMVAEAYFFGVGVETDAAEGVRWTLEAAEAGHPRALFEAGKFYAYGWGVEADHGRALRLLQAAAGSGLAEAAESLAFLHAGDPAVESDGGGPFDPAEAPRWFAESLRLRTAAAEAGSADDMALLAEAWAEGEPLVGGAVDDDEAARWARAAAEAGHRQGEILWARLLVEGRGVARDAERGRATLRRLADAGDAEAAFWLEEDDPTSSGLLDHLAEKARGNALPGPEPA